MALYEGEIYVDTSLITCAEYQLFIDNQQARGKWHQPDHWKQASFEKGQAQKPILGIRPSDARAFCDWLTKRESGLWQYRLPKKGEVQFETTHPPEGWQTPIGFWEDGEDMFTWIPRRSAHDEQFSQKTDQSLSPLDLDLHRIRQIRNTREENRVISLHHDLISDLARAIDLTRDLAHDLKRDLVLQW
jgi:Sulfatase-modifying factor enzyme 1